MAKPQRIRSLSWSWDCCAIPAEHGNRAGEEVVSFGLGRGGRLQRLAATVVKLTPKALHLNIPNGGHLYR